jgi:hypothetical protein
LGAARSALSPGTAPRRDLRAVQGGLGVVLPAGRPPVCGCFGGEQGDRVLDPQGKAAGVFTAVGSQGQAEEHQDWAPTERAPPVLGA